MNESTDQSRYLILGATGSLGSATVAKIVQRDTKACLLLQGRTQVGLDRLCSELPPQISTTTVVADASEPMDFESAISELVHRDNGTYLTGAVNAIGSLALKPITRLSLDEFRTTLDVNLISTFTMIRLAAPMMTRTAGSIVAISSAAAGIGMASHEAIAAAKAGIEGLVRASAASLGRSNIRVNAVSPGLFDSNLSSALIADPTALKASLALHTLKRVGQAADVASVVDFLLGPESTWVTGAVLPVDGGLRSLHTRPTL
jgi:NAD(P)-dependent dehydrogenase (short-subunit alcohol dehydrogenase family)